MPIEKKSNYLLGLFIDNISIDGAIAFIEDACNAKSSPPKHLATINMDFITQSLKDRDFRGALLEADLSSADSSYVVMICDFLGIANSGKVAGSDLLLELTGRKLSRTYNAVIFGTDALTAGRTQDFVNKNSPSLKVAGYISPPIARFEELSRQEYLDRINSYNADILFVSLSANKAIKWITQNRARLNTGFICQVGAGVDFLGGKARRAPYWMRKAALEWLWRLMHDMMLAKRYFRDAITLVYLFFKCILPYKILLVMNREGLASERELNFELIREGDAAGARITGAMNCRNHARTAELLNKLEATGRDVVLDLRGLTLLDNVSLAMLEKLALRLRKKNKELICNGISGTVERIFKYNLSDIR